MVMVHVDNEIRSDVIDHVITNTIDEMLFITLHREGITVAVSAKPNRSQMDTGVDEKSVQAVINRGGRIAESDGLESDVLKRVQLRIYSSQLNDIDNAIDKLKRDRKRYPNFSRHQFLLEAIEEKLDREL